MARPSERFVCQSCGAVSAKWAGRCDACGNWNSISEEALDNGPPGSVKARSGSVSSLATGKVIDFAQMASTMAHKRRLATGIGEFDRVCGGGLVPSSALLVGGDPGIGKSTLLLQVCAALGDRGRSTIYVSGEEAIEQLQMRAARLELATTNVLLAAETNLRDILASLETSSNLKPALVVIDSIQTMWSDVLGAAPGTVSQVRSCAYDLVRYAKKSGTSIVLIGHVTKDGQIAGPRVVEHMVDTVLYFEGERGGRYRILRAVKNRFGPANEIGVFDMGDAGLKEVLNPSELFLGNRGREVSGAAVFAGVEGSRPVLVEIQALVGPSPLGTPRRAVVGWDTNRLAMILAVLDTRCGLGISANDVYLNVAGGLKISEPAADLAVAAALVSSLMDVPLPQDTVIFGEISLSGAVRSVGQMDTRLKEAEKLGFSHAIVPSGQSSRQSNLTLKQVDLLKDLVSQLDARRGGPTLEG